MLAEENVLGWNTLLKDSEYIRNERLRPKEQDFFDWLLEHKDILDVGADGMTMAETLKALK